MTRDRAGSTPMPPQASPMAAAARDIVMDARRGVLCTLMPDGGYPYGSQVEVLPMADGDLVMCLSRLAEHQHFLAADPRAAVVLTPHLFDEQAMAKPRVTLVGTVHLVADRASVAGAYVRRHPGAAGYVDFADFLFYRLRPERVRYIAGFGQMGWLKGDAYREAFSAQQ